MNGPSEKFQEIVFIPEVEHVGVRIDKVIGALDAVGSRSRGEWLIDAGLVILGGKPIKSSYKIRTGDQFTLKIPLSSESTDLVPMKMDLEILHEDSELIVLNKPAGLVVHPAAGHEQDTLVNALLAHTQDLSFKFGEKRPGIVHRLDRDTSGILVVAKNDRSHELLSQQFRDRSIHRLYLALAIGSLRNKEAALTSFLARHPTHRKKYASVRGDFSQESPVPAGKWAKTHYQVLQSLSSQLHYLKIKLETGRTHQIRVHLSEAGAPVVGDELYGALKKINSLASVDQRNLIRSFPRFALHASELGFVHPKSHEKMFFKVGWPDDLGPLLEKLGVRVK